jgi:CheY-like chemotaxis protein
MLNATLGDGHMTHPTGNRVAKAAASQKVVIVNGSPEILGVLETVLEAGHYHVVFVESNEHAYSQIKRVQPDLVILCVHIEDADGFQVLSMLKLDEDTRAIPVVTYATEYDRRETQEDDAELSEADVFPPRRAELMN